MRAFMQVRVCLFDLSVCIVKFSPLTDRKVGGGGGMRDESATSVSRLYICTVCLSVCLPACPCFKRNKNHLRLSADAGPALRNLCNLATDGEIVNITEDVAGLLTTGMQSQEGARQGAPSRTGSGCGDRQSRCHACCSQPRCYAVHLRSMSVCAGLPLNKRLLA